MTLEIRKPYTQIRVQTVPEGESLTEQSHKKECDINNIMRKYQKTGAITHQNKHEAEYGFATGQTFLDAMLTVTKGQQMFDELPSSIRNKFYNDPAQFLDFVQDPANKQELMEMGLTEESDPTPTPPIDRDWETHQTFVAL